MQRTGNATPVAEFLVDFQALVVKPPSVIDLPSIVCKRSQLMQSAGNAALVAKFLIDFQALAVKPPRFIDLTLIAYEHSQLMQRDCNAALVVEFLCDFQTFVVKPSRRIQIPTICVHYCKVVCKGSDITFAPQYARRFERLFVASHSFTPITTQPKKAGRRETYRIRYPHHASPFRSLECDIHRAQNVVFLGLKCIEVFLCCFRV